MATEVTRFEDVSSSRFEDVGPSRFEDVTLPSKPSFLQRGLDVLAMPGDYTRGLITGQPGQRIDPAEFVNQMSTGGTEQVLRERGPLAATIRETAASVVDPLLLAGPVIAGARRVVGAIPQLARVPRPTPTLSAELPPVEPATIKPRGDTPVSISLPPGPLPLNTPLQKYAGSVNLERQDIPDTWKREVLKISEQVSQTPSLEFEEVTRQAIARGPMTVKDAWNFAKGGKKDPIDELRVRAVNAEMAGQVHEARQAYLVNPSQELANKFFEALPKGLQAFEADQLIGRQTAQSLAARKIQSFPSSIDEAMKAVNQAVLDIRAHGKYDQEMARRLLDLDINDAAAVQQFLRAAGTKTASWRAKIFEGWMAAVLSSPITHSVNTLSNTLFLGIRPFERLGSAVMELRAGGARERYFGEAVADSFGMIAGLKDGMRTFIHTMHTEVPLGQVSKLEGSVKVPAIEGTKGKIIRTPLTLLTATDDFFKTLATRGDLYAQAYRQAARDGITMAERPSFIANLVTNPTEQMMVHARSEATYRTFQKELGEGGKTLLQLRQTLPGSEYIVPFIQTPVNIAKTALERTPLNLIRIAELARRGKLTGADLSDEGARAIMGSMTGAYIASLAAEGVVSGGGPRDPEQRSALLATGWQPYSVKINKKYYSYQRLEPVGTILAMAADFAETREMMSNDEAKGVAGKIVRSVVKNFGDKTFLSGIQGIINVVSDPDRYADNWLEKMAGSAVAPAIPSAISSYARAQDPSYREVEGMLDAIQARIPGKAGVESLALRRDYFGEPIEKPGNFWTRFLSPVQVSAERDDLIRHKILSLGVEVAPLKRVIHLPLPKADAQGAITNLSGRNVELTRDEYDRLQVTAGGIAKTMVTGMIQAQGFENISTVVQKEQVKKAFTQAHELAVTQMRAELMRREAGKITAPLRLPPPPRPTDLPFRPEPTLGREQVLGR